MATDARTARYRCGGRVESTSSPGIWLVLAPFLLSYSDITGAVWNDILVGVVVAILAWIRVGRPLFNEGVGWTNLVLGVWLIVAPFVIGYGASTVALWKDVIVGVVVVVLAAMSAISSQGHHPGTGPDDQLKWRHKPPEASPRAGPIESRALTRPTVSSGADSVAAPWPNASSSSSGSPSSAMP